MYCNLFCLCYWLVWVIGCVCCIFYLGWLESGSVPSNNGFSGCGGVCNLSSLTFPLAQHNPPFLFWTLTHCNIGIQSSLVQYLNCHHHCSSQKGSYWNAKRLYDANDLRVLTRCLNLAFSLIIFCLSSLKFCEYTCCCLACLVRRPMFARRPLGILDYGQTGEFNLKCTIHIIYTVELTTLRTNACCWNWIKICTIRVIDLMVSNWIVRKRISLTSI